VVNYLARYVGKVDINQAKSQEIQEVVEFSAAEADAIVQYRTKNGDFADLAAVAKVPGVDAKKLAERKIVSRLSKLYPRPLLTLDQ